MADYKSTHTGAEIDAGIDKAVTADTNWNLLMANLGVGRWRGQKFFNSGYVDKINIIYDDMAKNCTNYQYMFLESGFYSFEGEINSYDIHFNNPTNFFNTLKTSINFYGAFMRYQNASVIYLPTMNKIDFRYMFYNSNFTKVLVEPGCSVIFGNTYGGGCFGNMSNLTEIGEIDMTYVNDLADFIRNSPNVKSIHCKHFKSSFDISASTAFEEADLVEIISNLDPVTTAPTLRMGTTNLAKLTDEEKKVATDKGWILA